MSDYVSTPNIVFAEDRTVFNSSTFTPPPVAPAATPRDKDWDGCFSCRWRKKKCAFDGEVDCIDCKKFNIRCCGVGQERPAGKPLAEQIRRVTKAWISDKANRQCPQPLDLEPIWIAHAAPTTTNFIFVNPAGLHAPHTETHTIPYHHLPPLRPQIIEPLFEHERSNPSIPHADSPPRAYPIPVPVCAAQAQYQQPTQTYEFCNSSSQSTEYRPAYNGSNSYDSQYSQYSQYPQYSSGGSNVSSVSPYTTDTGSFEYLSPPSGPSSHFSTPSSHFSSPSSHFSSPAPTGSPRRMSDVNDADKAPAPGELQPGRAFVYMRSLLLGDDRYPMSQTNSCNSGFEGQYYSAGGPPAWPAS